MKIIALTQARFGSTRLPGKVLKTIKGKTLLQIHLERILQSKLIDRLIVASTHEKEVDAFAPITDALGVELYRGSTEDVLDRFYQAAKPHQPTHLLRLTSDCPLLDGHLLDEVIRFGLERGVDYASNVLTPTFPDGEDIEVFTFAALQKAWNEATLPSDREHVTPYIWRNSSFLGGKLFSSDNYFHKPSYSEVRLTVDQQEDFDLIQRMIEGLGMERSWLEYAEYYRHSPHVAELNRHIQRNEGYAKSLKNDEA